VGISNFLCPDTLDIELFGNLIVYFLNIINLGNSYSSGYKSFEIVLLKCTVGCQTDADIDDMVSQTSIDATVINTYFDFDDYDSPVKTYLDDRFLLDLIGGFNIKKKVYLRENEAEVQDGFFYYTPDGDELDFVGFSRVEDGISPYTALDNAFFSKSTKQFRNLKFSNDLYKRSVF
jgi:hypothetical protein